MMALARAVTGAYFGAARPGNDHADVDQIALPGRCLAVRDPARSKVTAVVR